uniref:Uncharacterized protein n=1 Tax=Anopheles farauti TaxID=69004 RepID=A0A182QE52_9DIPT
MVILRHIIKGGFFKQGEQSIDSRAILLFLLLLLLLLFFATLLLGCPWAGLGVNFVHRRTLGGDCEKIESVVIAGGGGCVVIIGPWKLTIVLAAVLGAMVLRTVVDIICGRQKPIPMPADAMGKLCYLIGRFFAISIHQHFLPQQQSSARWIESGRERKEVVLRVVSSSFHHIGNFRQVHTVAVIMPQEDRRITIDHSDHSVGSLSEHNRQRLAVCEPCLQWLPPLGMSHSCWEAWLVHKKANGGH